MSHLSKYDAMLARVETPLDRIWEAVEEQIRDEGCPDCGNDNPQLYTDWDYDDEAATARCEKCGGLVGVRIGPDPDDLLEDRLIDKENRWKNR